METFSVSLTTWAGIHRSPVNSPHKGEWHRALMFSLICAWINSWVNNREAGDLRCQHPNNDVTVMTWVFTRVLLCIPDPRASWMFNPHISRWGSIFSNTGNRGNQYQAIMVIWPRAISHFEATLKEKTNEFVGNKYQVRKNSHWSFAV